MLVVSALATYASRRPPNCAPRPSELRAQSVFAGMSLAEHPWSLQGAAQDAGFTAFGPSGRLSLLVLGPNELASMGQCAVLVAPPLATLASWSRPSGLLAALRPWDEPRSHSGSNERLRCGREVWSQSPMLRRFAPRFAHHHRLAHRHRLGLQLSERPVTRPVTRQSRALGVKIPLTCAPGVLQRYRWSAVLTEMPQYRKSVFSRLRFPFSLGCLDQFSVNSSRRVAASVP